MKSGDLLILEPDEYNEIHTYTIGEQGEPMMAHRTETPCVYVGDEDCSDWGEPATKRFIIILCGGMIRTINGDLVREAP